MSRDKLQKQETLDCLLKSLHKYGMRTVLFQQNMAQKMGVVHTDLKTAEILNETGPITAGELSRITGLSSGSVTALIDRLEKTGYVMREKDEEDRRKVVITPIQKRQKQIKAHFESLAEATKEACLTYTEEELVVILGFVEKVIRIMDHENEKLMAEREENN
ncbi:MarR family winged helix-turn-helix transcriptional regulator [Peribacillus huizhouensis]|uniref:DNA-binding MarR family transcriptional regulator n=1 Tax=Peribacillus huizhouensis TaxID=1501239 RepID=A0ABR6CUT0_9BACI|nr:MarR family transcriptional regulator [Peribacillus huizhouensis]MBA9028792.1 DNA-binding MarR family transcriptional regulator [Peribacillus huizhouensis]